MKRREFNKFLVAGAVGSGLSVLTGPVYAQTTGGNELERIKASGVLRTVGVPDGAPYYQKSITDGKWRGFYVDIVGKLASDLGLKLDMREATWGTSVLELEAGKADVFFGLNPTPARKKVIDFSGPVFHNEFTLVVKKGLKGKTWEDFNKPNIRIAVDGGSSHDAAVTAHCPNAHIIRLKTQSAATAALQSGRADAQCLVIVLSLTLMAKLPSIGSIVIPTPIDSTTSNAGYHHRDKDKSWQNYVNNWIVEHRKNGFIKDAIIRNMALVGVTKADFPEGFSI